MPFNIEKTEVLPGIISLRFDSQYELCSTFMRLQEFYESPFEDIKGHHFTLEQYMDRYAKEMGNFTYTIDWGGFNVPGHIVRQFFDRFRPAGLLNKEHVLENLISREMYGHHVEGRKDFYVIGHYGPAAEKVDLHSTLAHEIAHGLYYLSPDYRAAATKLIEALPEKVTNKMRERLLGLGGYCEEVLPDEYQAYLSTSDDEYLKEKFGRGLKKYAKDFRALFKQYVKG